MNQIESLPGESKTALDPKLAVAKVSWRRTAIRVGVSGLSLAALFMILPREKLWEALHGLPLAAYLAGVGMYLTMHVMGVLKWRLTVNLTGAGLPLAQAGRAYYGGLFGNLFLPSILGGDVVRAGLAFGQARCRTALVVGCFLDRLLDLTALAIIALIGALLLPEHLGMVGSKVILPFGAALIVAALIFWVAWHRLPVRRLHWRLRRRLVKLRQAVQAVLDRPSYMIVSLTLGVTLQGSLVLLNAWLGKFCGLESSLAVWFFVWPLAKLSGVLPITQGGLGVREAALALLFVPFGVPAAVAFAVGLVFEGIVVTGGLVGGPLAFALGHVPCPRAQAAGA